MGLLAVLKVATWSFKKSGRLHELQLQIRPPSFDAKKLIESTLRDLQHGIDPTAKRDRAVEDFLDLCVRDSKVFGVMERYNLNRNDLRSIAEILDNRGLGWIRGHYAAYSTIAYSEPLEFFAEAMARDGHPQQIAAVLCDYWAGRIANGTLERHLPPEGE